MRTIIVGLGNQGKKHRDIIDNDLVGIVDPIYPLALDSIKDASLDHYDAAIVCTPNQEKQEIIKYLLSNKKHVMVEKPLIGTAVELEILRQLQIKNEVALQTAYCYRFEPLVIKLKELIDNGILGEIYLVRIFLGNGTAINVKNSPWRDRSRGVLEEISSHQFDLVNYLFDRKDITFPYIVAGMLENKAFDHVILHSEGLPHISIESTYCYWKNTFTIDVTGELGSAHVNGLLKWGWSHLTTRKRIFPSGVPEEQYYFLDSPDPTLTLQYEHFKELCKTGGTNIETDIWINNIFNEV